MKMIELASLVILFATTVVAGVPTRGGPPDFVLEDVGLPMNDGRVVLKPRNTDCQNLQSDSNCQYWADTRGYCEHSYVSFMETNCKKACNLCTTDGSGSSDCDYSTFSSSHSMNLPTNNNCGTIHRKGVSSSEIQTILRKHNEFRAKVANGQESRGSSGPQPSATNMLEMRWNTQLAEVAQAWAEQCPNGHDSSANRKVCDHNYVGQNIAYRWSFNPTPVWEASIDSLYNEVKDMPNSLVDSFGSSPNGKVIGHYTQMVWADTYEVGCGAIYYPDTFHGTNYPEAKIYVCNYGPGGNWRGEPIYEDGATASNCPNGPSSAYSGLCAAPSA